MEDIREYIEMLEQIEMLLDDLPMLNYDSEMETFYEKTYERLEKHKNVMIKRLEQKENEKMKVGA
jgi:hypothetical protein